MRNVTEARRIIMEKDAEIAAQRTTIADLIVDRDQARAERDVAAWSAVTRPDVGVEVEVTRDTTKSPIFGVSKMSGKFPGDGLWEITREGQQSAWIGDRVVTRGRIFLPADQEGYLKHELQFFTRLSIADCSLSSNWVGSGSLSEKDFNRIPFPSAQPLGAKPSPRPASGLMARRRSSRPRWTHERRRSWMRGVENRPWGLSGGGRPRLNKGKNDIGQVKKSLDFSPKKCYLWGDKKTVR